MSQLPSAPVPPLTPQRREQNKKVLDELQDSDPAKGIRGMPPNFGEYPLPQVITVNAIASSLGRVYRASDEALKDAAENARFMRNDTGIMECVEARQRSVALLKWHLEPEDTKSPLQKQLCADLTQIIERIPRFMQYRECLLHAIWHGVYANQHQLRWQNVGGKMRVGCAGWRPINGDKLVFRLDDGGHDAGQMGIRVGMGHKLGDVINGRHKVEQIEPTVRGLCYFLRPHERALMAVHKHQIEDGAYEAPEDAGKMHGVGVRSKIYWDWFQKQELLGFLMEYLERSAFGLEIWYYPMGAAGAEAKARTAAQERIGNGRNIILVPKPLGEDAHAFGVDHIEPGMSGVDALTRIITDYYGHRIKRYILGQTLTSEADATGLGSGVADIHLGTFLDIIKYDATNLQETITDDLVEPLKRWNFAGAANTLVRFIVDTESQDSEREMLAFKSAWEMGAKLKTADVMAAIGASIPGPDDEVLQSPQFTQVPGAGMFGEGGGQPGGAPGQLAPPTPETMQTFKIQLAQALGVAS